MLVLSRKNGESIQIDDNIFVTVTEVKGGRVRLAIDAPRSIRIVRKEVLERDFGTADCDAAGHAEWFSAEKPESTTPAECLN